MVKIRYDLSEYLRCAKCNTLLLKREARYVDGRPYGRECLQLILSNPGPFRCQVCGGGKPPEEMAFFDLCLSCQEKASGGVG